MCEIRTVVVVEENDELRRGRTLVYNGRFASGRRILSRCIIIGECTGKLRRTIIDDEWNHNRRLVWKELRRDV